MRERDMSSYSYFVEDNKNQFDSGYRLRKGNNGNKAWGTVSWVSFLGVAN
jgi:hypothetical protein